MGDRRASRRGGRGARPATGRGGARAPGRQRRLPLRPPHRAGHPPLAAACGARPRGRRGRRGGRRGRRRHRARRSRGAELDPVLRCLPILPSRAPEPLRRSAVVRAGGDGGRHDPALRGRPPRSPLHEHDVRRVHRRAGGERLPGTSRASARRALAARLRRDDGPRCRAQHGGREAGGVGRRRRLRRRRALCRSGRSDRRRRDDPRGRSRVVEALARAASWGRRTPPSRPTRPPRRPS